MRFTTLPLAAAVLGTLGTAGVNPSTFPLLDDPKVTIWPISQPRILSCSTTTPWQPKTKRR
jgi:hypothetical protein